MMITFAKPIAVARGLAEIATMGVFAVTTLTRSGVCSGAIYQTSWAQENNVLLLALTSVLSLCVNIVRIFDFRADSVSVCVRRIFKHVPAFVIASAASLSAIILTLLIKPVKEYLGNRKG